jgi:hypothetical protein
MQCTVQYKQGRGGKADEGSNSSISLFINGSLVDTRPVPAFKFKLNHKLIVGNIPTDPANRIGGVLVSDVYFTPHHKSALDSATVTQATLRDFVSVYPPAVISRTLTSGLALLRLSLEVLFVELRETQHQTTHAVLSAWEVMKDMLLAVLAVSDEPTAKLVFRIHEFFFEFTARCDSVPAGLESINQGLRVALDAFVGMAHSFVDCNIDVILEAEIGDTPRRVWLERVIGNELVDGMHISVLKFSLL